MSEERLPEDVEGLLRKVRLGIGRCRSCSDVYPDDSVAALVTIANIARRCAETERYLATARREIDAVDTALPAWKFTGRGRVETIEALRAKLAEAEAKVAELEAALNAIADNDFFEDDPERMARSYARFIQIARAAAARHKENDDG